MNYLYKLLMNMIIQSLIYVDIFGHEPKFTFYNNKKFKNIFGGILSIFVYAALLYVTITLGQELYLKRHPTVISSSEFDQCPRRFDINFENFGLFIGVENSAWEYYNDSRIYTLSAVFSVTYAKAIDGDMMINTTSYPLILEQCEQTRHFPKFKNLFGDRDLVNVLCINPDNFTQIYLAGRWYEEIYASVVFSVTACKNSTKNNNSCLAQEVVEKNLDGAIIASEFINTIFDPSDFENPQKFIRETWYTSMSYKYTKSVDFLFKNIDYVTDTSSFTENLNTVPYLQLDSTKERTDFVISEKFLKINLKLGNIRQIYNRKYIKLQEVIAQVGGLVKGIMIIVAFVYDSLAESLFFIKLINYLFIFPNKSPQNDVFIYGQIPIRDITIFKPNSLQVQSYTDSNVKISIEEKLKKFNKKVKPSCCAILKSSYLPCRLKSEMTLNNIELYNTARKVSEQMLDITYLLRMFQELEILAFLLLDRNQRKLFITLKENVPWNKALQIEQEFSKSSDAVLEDTMSEDTVKKRLDKLISFFYSI